jgi:thiol-disulfide isomerase/thioredoxin
MTLKGVGLRLLAPLALVIACVAVFFGTLTLRLRAVHADEMPPTLPALAGTLAPRTAFQTTDGSWLRVPQNTRPVVLEIMATWCPHCQSEIGPLNELSRSGRVRVVGVVADRLGQHQQPENERDIRDFIQRFHVRYPLSAQPQLTINRRYHTVGYPMIVFIRPGGVVSDVIAGDSTVSQLRAATAELLKRS